MPSAFTTIVVAEPVLGVSFDFTADATVLDGEKAELTADIASVEADLARYTATRAGLVAVAFQAPAAFLRSYILRRGFMDGMAGFILSVMMSKRFMRGEAMFPSPFRPNKAPLPYAHAADD